MIKNVKRCTSILMMVAMLFNLCLLQVQAESIPVYANECLDMRNVTTFEYAWSDFGSWGRYHSTYYKPVAPEGYSLLGYYGQVGYDQTTGSALVVKEKPGQSGILAKPVDYQLVWNDKGTFAFEDGYFWRPVPPTGYVALGMVVTSGTKPDINEVVCVRKDLTVSATAGSFIWNDTGSWANQRFGVWSIQPASVALGAITTGTFVGVTSRTAPTTNPLLYCLKNKPLDNRISSLNSAFQKDGYAVLKQLSNFNKIAMVAEHTTSLNYDTKQKKKIYYLEGTHYQMGYNLGIMAEKDISVMANDFSKGIILSYLKIKDPERYELIGDLLVATVTELARNAYETSPKEIKDEIEGLYDGCKVANPSTKVDIDHLIALNYGIDVLCSLAYTSDFLFELIPDLTKDELVLPIWCNAFDISGKSAGYGNYFGRDFMFSTADVFQNLATMIIYNPDNNTEKKSLPFVSVTGPGIVGSITSMNINGVASGVDMSPAINNNPEDLGINSLLLARRAIEYGSNAIESVNLMKDTKRGVSWNYIIADGSTDKAAIVEAGASTTTPDFFKYLPESIKPLLPDINYINTHKSTEFQNGLMVRWNDYQYPTAYLDFNKSLFNYYNATQPIKVTLYDDAFTSKGYVNKTLEENNCPMNYYFAPQKEQNSDVLLVTNHYIIPEMRLFAMNAWDNFVIGNRNNDIQWRYDELSNQIQTAIETKGQIDYATAKTLIDYLAPYGKFPEYYGNGKRSRDGKEIQIGGAVSICDLKSKTIESHYGYYSDSWIKITLPNYFN